jgi:hypothetical protein
MLQQDLGAGASPSGDALGHRRRHGSSAVSTAAVEFFRPIWNAIFLACGLRCPAATTPRVELSARGTASRIPSRGPFLRRSAMHARVRRCRVTYRVWFCTRASPPRRFYSPPLPVGSVFVISDAIRRDSPGSTPAGRLLGAPRISSATCVLPLCFFFSAAPCVS